MVCSTGREFYRWEDPSWRLVPQRLAHEHAVLAHEDPLARGQVVGQPLTEQRLHHLAAHGNAPERREDQVAERACDDDERAYMLRIFRQYFPDTSLDGVEIEDFAGLRPLIRSATDPSKATREYALQREGNLISVFGGRWTTSHALARKVSSQIQ